MQKNNLLDAPIPDPIQQKARWRIKTLFTIEVFLWLARFLGAFFIIESVAGAREIVILSAALLALLYMTVPHLLMASQTKWQRIGSFGTGFALAFALIARMMILASWPGASIFCLLSFPLSIAVALGLAYALITKPSRWKEGSFYKHLLVRLLLAIWLGVGLFSYII